MSISVLRQLLMKEAVKKSAGSSGIMSINKNIAADVDKLLQKYINDAMQQGVDIETLSPDQLKMIVAMNQSKPPRVISGTSDEGKAITEKFFGKKGEVVEFPQKRSFKEEIDAMKKSGDLVDEDNMVISKKITDREMFKNSNLNKPTIEGQMEKINKASNRIDEIKKEQAAMYKPKVDTVEETVTYIKTLEPMTALKEANLVIGRKGKYKDLTPDQSKKILQDTEDHIFERDIPDEDFAKGGRAGFQQGGLPMVDPRMNLDYDTFVEQNVDKRLQDPTFLNNIKETEGTLGPITKMPVGEGSVTPILPVEPRNQPGSLEEYLSGYADYTAKNPNTYGGTQALIPATLPGGFNYTFRSGAHANHFNDYLESIGLSPYERYDQKLRPEDETMVNQFKPEDMAKGGRAGFYTGGITDVEPSLDDIGHGSDSLMARTRLVSPGSQATTSTGLNYLLAEDNDNIRVPFAGGGGGRRAFLKLLATLGGATAAAKSGILTLGEGGAKKAITETVKQSAGGTYPPPYFFKLVEKIKFMGDDVTEKAATQEREIVKRYKDYEMTEDIGTGNIVIKKRNEGSFYDQDGIISDEYIVYKPGQADELTKGKKPPPEYDEYTVRPDSDGKLRDSEDGLDSIDEILEEVGDPDSMTLKKADGGRIGFKVGGSGKKFIEKIFGKGSLDVMKARDPELHKGMLEVVEMFRNRDKEGLKMYLQKFLPHMDDETIEAFIVGDAADAAGQGKYGLDNIQGQLIRLGSGRDYAGKIKMVKDAENMRALDKLDVTDRKPNAYGGLQTMLGE